MLGHTFSSENFADIPPVTMKVCYPDVALPYLGIAE